MDMRRIVRGNTANRSIRRGLSPLPDTTSGWAQAALVKLDASHVPQLVSLLTSVTFLLNLGSSFMLTMVVLRTLATIQSELRRLWVRMLPVLVRRARYTLRTGNCEPYLAQTVRELRKTAYWTRGRRHELGPFLQRISRLDGGVCWTLGAHPGGWFCPSASG